MNPEKAREIIEKYRKLLESIPKANGPFDKEPTEAQALQHAHGMLDKMEGFLDLAEDESLCFDPVSEEAWDKFNRWLGFVQGAFWLTGTYTINEMREHNRTERVE